MLVERGSARTACSGRARARPPAAWRPCRGCSRPASRRRRAPRSSAGRRCRRTPRPGPGRPRSGGSPRCSCRGACDRSAGCPRTRVPWTGNRTLTVRLTLPWLPPNRPGLRRSWRERPALHQPDWPDPVAVEAVRERLSALPPLVFAGEARQLRESLAQVAAGRGVPAAGRRLRRVVRRLLGHQHPREAEDHPADGGRVDLRLDAAGGQAGPDRRPVRQAALVAHRAGGRRRAARRSAATWCTARSRPREARVFDPERMLLRLPPVGGDAEPAARVHQGRLRRPHQGAPVEPGVRGVVAGGPPLRA